MKFVSLIETGPELYVATMTTVISYSCYSQEQTNTHINCLKIKDHPGENVADLCNAILVDADHLVSTIYFKTKHLDYIKHVFWDTFYPRFHIWATHKYKQVTDFIQKIRVCDKDIM